MSDRISIGQALDLGTQLAMAGKHRAAIGYFRGVLNLDSQNFEAIERLGASLFDMRELYEALYWFWRGIKTNPKSAMGNTNYGLALTELGHPEESIEYLSRAVAFAGKTKNTSPTVLGLVYSNLGNTLVRIHEYKNALTAIDRAITFIPSNPFPHYNRGVCLRWMNRSEEALVAFDRAIELHGHTHAESQSIVNISDVKYNKGIIQLLLGDFAHGWENYESRLTTSENKIPNFNLPVEKKWDGDDLTGKTLLVYAEQGLGDTIQFARFLPKVVEQMGASRVQLVLHTALRGFVKVPGVEVLTGGESFDGYDYWVALMSLPHIIGFDSEEDIRSFEPWFPTVPDDRLAAACKWLDTLRAPLGDGLEKTLVGVCWSGNFEHKNDKHRSIPLKVFSKLFDTPGCEFICLQPIRQEDDEAVAKLGAKLHHPKITDWNDTAALTMFLDKVVTVDTAVAHLAGSIGTPTTVLVPAFSTDWRWQNERTDSPWYPSVRLERQNKIGDWRDTIARISVSLSKT